MAAFADLPSEIILSISTLLSIDDIVAISSASKWLRTLLSPTIYGNPECSALIYGATYDLIDMIDVAIKAGADPNITWPKEKARERGVEYRGNIHPLAIDYKGDVNPLVVAVDHHHLEIVHLLCDAGAIYPNVGPWKHFELLHIAIKLGQDLDTFPPARDLEQHLKQVDGFEQDILHYALRSPGLDLIQYILHRNVITITERHIEAVDWSTPNFRLLLEAGYLPAIEDVTDEESVLMAIRYGADVNMITPRWTPLHVACYLGFDKAVQPLLDRGVDATLSRLCLSNRWNEQDWNVTPLAVACDSGYLDIVEILVNHGSVISDPREGWQLLKRSCQQRDSAMVNWILSNPAKCSLEPILDSCHLLSLVCATSFGYTRHLDEHVVILSQLLEHGFDPNIGNYGTPEALPHLSVACKSGDIEIVRKLLRYGADITARDDVSGKMAIHYAESEAIVDELLFHGADINATCNNGQTLLHIMCTSKYERSFIKFLLRRGADGSACDENGWTPLLLVPENPAGMGRKKMRKLFEKYDTHRIKGKS